MMRRSKAVDAWFASYENPMKDVVERIRAIVLAADKRIDECIKWQAPTFTYKGNLASFYPKSKQHASLMFHVGAKIPGKHALLDGTGPTSRVMKIGSVADANAAKAGIEAIVRSWCAWRDAGAEPVKPSKSRTTASKPATRRPAKAKPSSKRRSRQR